MDLMEQIRLEATKYADDCKAQTNANWWEVGDAFQSGAQALLNLLGRSATSEGHPPRVWVRFPNVWKEAPEHWDARMKIATPEYLSLSEHQALRAADLLEIERLKKNSMLSVFIERIKYEEASCAARCEDLRRIISQEREARKGDIELMKAINDTVAKQKQLDNALAVEREKNARLTAALEKIATGKGISNPEDCPEVAREALGEAGK